MKKGSRCSGCPLLIIAKKIFTTIKHSAKMQKIIKEFVQAILLLDVFTTKKKEVKNGK